MKYTVMELEFSMLSKLDQNQTIMLTVTSLEDFLYSAMFDFKVLFPF